MKKKLLFLAVALLLIMGTTLTFAHSNLAASVSITAAGSDASTVQSVGRNRFRRRTQYGATRVFNR